MRGTHSSWFLRTKPPSGGRRLCFAARRCDPGSPSANFDRVAQGVSRARRRRLRAHAQAEGAGTPVRAAVRAGAGNGVARGLPRECHRPELLGIVVHPLLEGGIGVYNERGTVPSPRRAVHRRNERDDVFAARSFVQQDWLKFPIGVRPRRQARVRLRDHRMPTHPAVMPPTHVDITRSTLGQSEIDRSRYGSDLRGPAVRWTSPHRTNRIAAP